MKCENNKCWLNNSGKCKSIILKTLGVKEKNDCGEYKAYTMK